MNNPLIIQALKKYKKNVNSILIYCQLKFGRGFKNLVLKSTYRK